MEATFLLTQHWCGLGGDRPTFTGSETDTWSLQTQKDRGRRELSGSAVEALDQKRVSHPLPSSTNISGSEIIKEETDELLMLPGISSRLQTEDVLALTPKLFTHGMQVFKTTEEEYSQNIHHSTNLDKQLADVLYSPVCS
ncbi:hypothetical protein AMECASPLE_032567 [Ameca splendens]|uniref:Uncharacterized protein n=1 Tax=Ameca splendens TaxID=208324 RepID=A0ABV0YTN6_9TELE